MSERIVSSGLPENNTQSIVIPLFGEPVTFRVSPVYEDFMIPGLSGTGHLRKALTGLKLEFLPSEPEVEHE